MNVLWITCDEIKAKALRLYGNPLVPLPAFERVASEGVIFCKNFVQVPKCIPARPSMLTGRYPHVDGLRTMSTESFQGDGWMTLDENAPNLLKWTKNSGFRTAIFGKNHWTRHEVEKKLLDACFCGGDGFPSASEKIPAIMRRAYFGGRVDKDYQRFCFVDEKSVSETMRFMGTSGKTPFFVLLDISQPHPPYFEWPEFADDIPLESVPLPQVPPIDKAPFVERVIRETFDLEELSELQRRRIIRAYWSQCRYADSLVGRILDFLDSTGLSQNTLLILNADHGDFAGEHNCYEKWDTSFLDCIIQVPLLMRLPGKIREGIRLDHLTEQVDIAPTILDLLGMQIPPTIQGKSLLPLIEGRTSSHKDAVFCQGGVEERALQKPGLDYRSKLLEPYWNKQRTLVEHPKALIRSHMVRTKTRKLVYRLSGHHELYDLAKDPDELQNVYGNSEYEKDRVELESKLLRFFVEKQNEIPIIKELWA